jgi:hypothetical protein
MTDAMNGSDRHNHLIFLDSMRGLIMLLMALDHAAFFIAKTPSHEFWGTALPRYDDALPFLLRAVTHLCAPGFFLLMGVGMALFIAARVGEGWANWRVARFFVIRGFMLIVFQQFLENPAWYLGSLGTATAVYPAFLRMLLIPGHTDEWWAIQAKPTGRFRVAVVVKTGTIRFIPAWAGNASGWAAPPYAVIFCDRSHRN